MEDIQEVSPPGFEGTVKAMKKHKDIDNPYALAWHMKNKGYKSHKKKDGTDKVKKEGFISFSNFIAEAEKELPKCPEGYKYNRDTKRCEPKKSSDDVKGKLSKGGGSSGVGYSGRVIGSHGQNGAPPAYGEKSSGHGLYMSRDGDMGTSGWSDQFTGGLGSNPMGTS